MGLPLYSAGFATGPKARPFGSCPKAPVAELVDALDSKSSSARSAGSIPARGTTLRPAGYAWRSRAEHAERSVSGEAERSESEDGLPRVEAVQLNPSPQ